MQTIQAPLQNAKKLTNDVWQFDFGWGESGSVEFQPGQFFILKVKDGKEPAVNRSYSIASPPGSVLLGEEAGFSMCIKLIPGGRGSEYLRGMKPGDEAEFMAPVGHFVLKDSPKEVIMVATGTGLAPFMSMLPVLFERGNSPVESPKKITLLFGVRHKEDLFYMEELRAWEEQHENFRAVCTLSRPCDNWEGDCGRVTAHLEKMGFDPAETKVYICGNGPMVKSVKTMMQERGIERGDLHFELFTPL